MFFLFMLINLEPINSRLKHHHRKKTVNRMEDLILCSQCARILRSIEKQEKEIVSKKYFF